MKNDKNEPLLVEKEELKYILKEIIDDKQESQIDEIILMAGDQNEDGLINFDLFVKTVTDEAMY